MKKANEIKSCKECVYCRVRNGGRVIKFFCKAKRTFTGFKLRPAIDYVNCYKGERKGQ